MREHALTKSPLHAYAPESEDGDLWFARLALDEKETWPSELPTSGRAGWKTFERGSDGSVDVVYPDVKWVSTSVQSWRMGCLSSVIF